MNSRRNFLKNSSIAGIMLMAVPQFVIPKNAVAKSRFYKSFKPLKLIKKNSSADAISDVENIVFSRPSSATYFNSSGILSYANQNLLTFSGDIGNSNWNKEGSTATPADKVNAPDGSKTAKILTETSSKGEHRLSHTVTVNVGVRYTFSIYLKAGTCTKVRLSFMNPGSYSGGNPNVFVNLLTGSIISKTANVLNTGITDEGDGWWRIAVTGNPDLGTSSGFQLFMLNSIDNINYSGEGRYLYIWGSQFEAGSVPTDYFATENFPYSGERYNYDPSTLKLKGLMIEPAATNILKQSGNLIDTSIWLHRNIIVHAEKFTAPDGTEKAVKLIEDFSWDAHYLRPADKPVVVRGQIYTFSAFIRAGERKWAYFKIEGATVHFDLSDGTVGRSVNPAYLSVNIERIGNGWYRCSGTVAAEGTRMDTSIGVEARENLRKYWGDGSSGIYVWGPQLETGGVATSYIPTNAKTATRGRETCRLLPPSSSSHDILIQRTNGGSWADNVTNAYVVPASVYELQTSSFWEAGTSSSEKEEIVETLYPPEFENAGFSKTKLHIFKNKYRVQSPNKSYSVNIAKNKSSQIYRFQLNSGDQWSSDAGKNKERSELYSLDKMPFDQDVWLSYAIRVAPGEPVSSGFCHFGQFHATEDPGDVASVPVLTFRFAGENDLSITTCANKDRIARVNTTGVVRYRGKLERGVWVRNVMRIRFSPTDAQLQWWENGVEKLDLSGIGMGNNDLIGPYWKFGIYRSKSPETLIAEYANMELSATESLRDRINNPLIIS